jgi:cytochrome c peroxidase
MLSRLLWLATLGVAMASCNSSSDRQPIGTDPASATLLPPTGASGPIIPLVAPRLDAAKIALGERLFSDRRLSHDDTISCANCHDLKRAGTDRRAVSIGIHGAIGQINAPTVYNSGFNIKQFWDGRADTLEAQIDGPLTMDSEMGSSWPEALAKLRRDPEYLSSFGQIYRDGVGAENVKDALATFERSLVTVDSRFDRFLRGQANAITADERRGYELFKSYGCATCHQGANVGGNMFQTLGIMGNYFGDRGHVIAADYGRYNVTKLEEDRFQFRVPSLRLAVLTAPYFHDGSVKTLDEAIDIMAKYQLGREIPDTDRELIIAFLATLPGELPKAQ